MKITNDITVKSFRRLLDYLGLECDTITFFLTNYNERWYTEKNIQYFPNRQVGEKLLLNKSAKNLDEYTDFIEKKFPWITENCIHKYIDIEYQHTLSNVPKVIYKIRFNKQVLESIKSYNIALFDWKHPGFPEDLCFFNQQNLILSTVAHEKLCFVEKEDKKISEILSV